MLAPYKGNYDVFRGCVITTFIYAYYENVAVYVVLLQLAEQLAKAQRLADEEFETKRLNVCKSQTII